MVAGFAMSAWLGCNGCSRTIEEDSEPGPQLESLCVRYNAWGLDAEGRRVVYLEAEGGQTPYACLCFSEEDKDQLDVMDVLIANAYTDCVARAAARGFAVEDTECEERTEAQRSVGPYHSGPCDESSFGTDP